MHDDSNTHKSGLSRRRFYLNSDVLDWLDNQASKDNLSGSQFLEKLLINIKQEEHKYKCQCK